MTDIPLAPLPAADHYRPIEDMSSAVIVLNDLTEAEIMNRPAARLLGNQLVVGSPIRDIFRCSGAEGDVRLPAMPKTRTTAPLRLKDGSMMIMMAKRLSRGGWVLTLTPWSPSFADLSLLIRESEMSRIDSLTGLANRAGLQAGVAQFAQAGTDFALFILDLDRFKFINDAFGHPAGDALLCSIAVRLLNLVDDGDIVARLGGDEFVMVRQHLATRHDVEAFAAFAIRAISQPHCLEGHHMDASTSIGGVLCPGGGTSLTTLLKCADAALYSAKRAGRSRFFLFESDEARYGQR